MSNPIQDVVNHPNHYQTKSGIEVIDFIESIVGEIDDGTESFLTGQVLKYISRWNKKNGLEDLEKAKWYLNRLINYEMESLEPLPFEN